MTSALDDIINFTSSASSTGSLYSNSNSHLESDLYDTSDNNKIINVSDCLRLHSGDVIVKGTINSISRLYKMVKSVVVNCKECEQYKIDFSEPLNEYQVNQNLTKKCE